MKTLKLTLGSSVAIAIANRSHMRHTSSQARQLDPLREARGRLRGSEPQGGCNACPLNEALSWGLLEGDGAKAPSPLFSSAFQARTACAPHAAKSPARLLSEPSGLCFNIMMFGSRGNLKPGVRLRSTRRNDFPSAPRANARGIDPRFRVRQEAPHEPKLKMSEIHCCSAE